MLPGDCIEPEECSCPCHRSGGAMVHCVPCCETCSICGAHIRFGMMESHMKRIHPNITGEDVLESLIYYLKRENFKYKIEKNLKIDDTVETIVTILMKEDKNNE